ncbi:MAG: hypothetical protein OEM67_11580 [Thermoleophilia bacterium]|nr:hypothetical protein [Thermoleophilia bacterium]
MRDQLDHERSTAEAALGHPVPHLLPAGDDLPILAGSIAGDPARARVAWVEPESARVVARVACPPGRPSRGRPVVAAVVDVAMGDGLEDRVLVARLVPEAEAVRVIVASDLEPEPAPAGPEGLALVRLAAGVPVVAVDALDGRGEAVGRLARAGLSELRSDGLAVSGRLGATHGMSAGFGAGAWKETLDEAAFEAGFTPILPTWAPPGFELGRPRVEPDVSYPSGPPSIVMAWTRGDGSERILLRQTVAPLASPAAATQWSSEVDVGGHVGHISGRRLGILVWERPDLAFGIQVRGISRPEDIALRVARSIPPG